MNPNRKNPANSPVPLFHCVCGTRPGLQGLRECFPTYGHFLQSMSASVGDPEYFGRIIFKSIREKYGDVIAKLADEFLTALMRENFAEALHAANEFYDRLEVCPLFVYMETTVKVYREFTGETLNLPCPSMN